VPGPVSDPADREAGLAGLAGMAGLAGIAATDEREPAPVRRLRPNSRATDRGTSGRERHDEKITVYVSSEELFALERARLVLRSEHGIAVDRGRMVREAVAELLVDLDAHGDDSILVRRLHR
jgi:hypothetical protein